MGDRAFIEPTTCVYYRPCYNVGMSDAPKRRRFRYSLRTLFVVVTVLGCWLGYQLHRIGERRQFLAQPHVSYGYEDDENPFSDTDPPITADAPWSLRIFGERGVAVVNLIFDSDEPRRPTTEEEAQGIVARKLFPEAKVQVFANPLLRWRSRSSRP
jgi:hypothetical protein